MLDCDLAALRARLLDWYDSHRRDLPWRAPANSHQDPYRVWLSEVMLQQTRVDTVRPYFERWVRRFPTLEALADASLDEVLKEWEGLGYYSRARNLHRAVREVRDRYGGRIPDHPETFRSLPGVGRYTAGAVMSIAYGREEPVVDGNVRRVYARWMDASQPSEPELWSLASRIVVGDRPGCINQAVMELGATRCTPRNPRCDECPVASFCAARTAGTQHERPERRRRAPLPQESRVAAVIEQEGRFLLARRPTRGRLGGMWEFPGGLMNAGEGAVQALPRVLGNSLGIVVEPQRALQPIAHVFTHVRVMYHPVVSALIRGDPVAAAYDDVRWLAADELDSVALPRAQQRIAAMIGR